MMVSKSMSSSDESPTIETSKRVEIRSVTVKCRTESESCAEAKDRFRLCGMGGRLPGGHDFLK